MLSITALILIASTLGTVTGFGTSTIMMPILMVYYPTPEVLLFVSIVHWFNALIRVFLFREGLDWKLIFFYGFAGIIAAYFGAKTFLTINPELVSKIITVFLLAYSIFLWLNPKFQIKYSNLKASVFGSVSGFIAGLFGMGGAIRGAFLSSFNLPKAVYLANAAFILLLIDSSRLTTYFSQGMSFDSILSFSETSSWLILSGFLVASIIGVNLGKAIVNKVPQDKFRLGIALFLAAIAIKLFMH